MVHVGIMVPQPTGKDRAEFHAAVAQGRDPPDKAADGSRYAREKHQRSSAGL
jgi:hypothetical protein